MKENVYSPPDEGFGYHFRESIRNKSIFNFFLTSYVYQYSSETITTMTKIWSTDLPLKLTGKKFINLYCISHHQDSS